MSWVIELENVHLLYGQTCVLDVERLKIAAAERVFVVGRSGSGKTTLERLIKGGLRPSAGRVTVLGCDPASRVPSAGRAGPRRIAMIDQEFFLVPRLGVVANVLTGCLGRSCRNRCAPPQTRAPLPRSSVAPHPVRTSARRADGHFLIR